MLNGKTPSLAQIKVANLLAGHCKISVTELTRGIFIRFNELNRSIIVYFVYCAKPSNLEAQLVSSESLEPNYIEFDMYMERTFPERPVPYDLSADYIVVRTEAELAALHADALYRSSIVVFERDPGDALSKDKIRFALCSGNQKLRRLFDLLSEISPLVEPGESFSDWNSFRKQAAAHSVAVIDENLLPSDAALGELSPGFGTVLLAKSVHTEDSEYDVDRVWKLVDEQGLNAYLTPKATLQDLEGGIVAAALNGHYLNAQEVSWSRFLRPLRRISYYDSYTKAREAFSAYCQPGAAPETLAEVRASFRNRFWPEDYVRHSDLIAD